MSGSALLSYGVIAACLLLICAWIVHVRNRSAAIAEKREEESRAYQARCAEHRSKVDVVEQAREKLMAELSAQWPVRAKCEVESKTADLLLRADSVCLRVIPGRGKDTFDPESMFTVNLADVVKIEKHRPTHQRTVSRTETVYVPQANKKSPIGRTLVGGALLGPVGAIAGAASSMKGPGMRKEERTVDEKETYEGHPVLHLTTCNSQRPLIKLRLPSVAQTEEWEARIVAGMAKSRELPRPLAE